MQLVQARMKKPVRVGGLGITSLHEQGSDEAADPEFARKTLFGGPIPLGDAPASGSTEEGTHASLWGAGVPVVKASLTNLESSA